MHLKNLKNIAYRLMAIGDLLFGEGKALPVFVSFPTFSCIE
jgi:hypothetical protein